MHSEFGALQYFISGKPYSLLFIADENYDSCPTAKDLLRIHFWRWLISITFKKYTFFLLFYIYTYTFQITLFPVGLTFGVNYLAE